MEITAYPKAPVIIDTASGAIASFEDGADGMPIKSLTVNIEPVQVGSGDPSPSNVRPISGWTGMNVSRTGINVWDEEWESGVYSILNGNKSDNPNYIRSKNIICIHPNTTYYIHIPISTVETVILMYDINQNYTNRFISLSSSRTFTTDEDAYYCHFYTKESTYGNDFSINYPSTDYDYHPSTGNTTIPISWQTEASTVYGGTLDVTTGLLTVDHAVVDGGTLTWNYWYDTFYYTAVVGKAANRAATDVKCDIYPTLNGAVPDVYGIFNTDTSYVYISDPSVSKDAAGAAALKEKLSGHSIWYPLATPLTVTISAEQLNTLYGTNNVWADTGDVTVEYPADTKLYIERINAPTDDDMTADTQIASGKYFIIGNNLYLSTTTIPAGDTIIPGTNCTKTDLAAALNALNT